MAAFWKSLVPIFLLLIAFTLIEGGLTTDYADARSKGGGKSFSSNTSKTKTPASTAAGAPTTGSSMGRGLMGGLLGGAIGGMLFGSMFGGEGGGMGMLPLLLLGGGAFFLYRKFAKARQGIGNASLNHYGQQGTQSTGISSGDTHSATQSSPAPISNYNLVEDGINQIKQADKSFEPAYFTEIASDVFFQVQAGWMHRELDNYRHLLGEQLAREYEGHFVEMRSNGHINKLESIAIRGVEIIQAGSDGLEDFVTVLFTANLLDYTINDKSGELISGSKTSPVKFREEWTWARSTGTQEWRLEGIKEA